MDDNGKIAGFEIDLGNELCKRAELTCEWVVNDWDSIIPNLLGGNYDAIMAGMSITDERKQSIDFSADYFPPDPSRFAVRSGGTFDFDNLSGANIGAQGGTIQAAHAEATFGANNTIKTYETFDQSVADLGAGTIDILLADGSALAPVVEGPDFEFVGHEVMIGGGIGIGMRKDDDDLEKKMNAAIDSVKQDGTLDALIKEYFDKGPFYAN